MRTVILAGGLGTRLGEETSTGARPAAYSAAASQGSLSVAA
jgi:hypothetical protein